MIAYDVFSEEGCEYCNYPNLDGFNYDMINDYSGDIGLSVDIRNNYLDIEVDIGSVTMYSVEIRYCPMCGSRLDRFKQNSIN